MYGYMLKEKLQLLRQKLKVWNVWVFGWMDLRIELVVKEFNEIDELLYIIGPSSKEELVVRRNNFLLTSGETLN